MNASEAIRARRSIRKYLPGEKIPREHIRQMLEAAMCAPSAMNARPWKFIVVENEEIRKAIPSIHPYCSFAPDASLAIVVCGLPEAWPDAPGEGMWPQDCGAAVENLLLEATELGYGTCWCGLYPHRERVAAFQALLGETAMPFALVTIGKAAVVPKQRGFYEEAKVRYIP